MKKLVLIALLFIIAIACKKKVTTTPQPTCTTTTPRLSGRYLIAGNNTDTVIITFLYNNCPTLGSNTYSIRNLDQALVPYVGTATLSSVRQFTLVSHEGLPSGNINGMNCYIYKSASNSPDLMMNSSFAGDNVLLTHVN